MKRVLFKGISLTTHNILRSSTKTNQNPVHSFNPLAASIRSRLRFYSSESDSPVEKKPDPVIGSASVAEAHVKDVALPIEDVSNKGKNGLKNIGFGFLFGNLFIVLLFR
ncbi:hypothetical protein Gotur_024553 [Gossypium turneri]